MPVHNKRVRPEMWDTGELVPVYIHFDTKLTCIRISAFLAPCDIAREFLIYRCEKVNAMLQ